ncbi:YraN family protein [Edaphobacter bradus]|uniref:YraN family protein n=1 Tax=Edaphobacter bradus TaxID=2259016 RepID=UPI0021E0292F|nr:YraN family protein [Edaphobacter bradus]
MSWVSLQARMLRGIDGLTTRLRGPSGPPHLVAGELGEREALFHLRGLGYTVVAQRWRTPKLRGDVDLIAWDGEWLCFIEVKARSSRVVAPAEAAVDEEKQRMLRRMARAYLRGLPEAVRREVAVRFDVVSVYFEPGGNEFEVNKGAFRWA